MIYKEIIEIPNIKQVPDLRNYTELLHEVKENSPVYLTRKGVCIVKLEDLEKLKATAQLLIKLETGEKSAREEGWLSADDVEEMLGL